MSEIFTAPKPLPQPTDIAYLETLDRLRLSWEKADQKQRDAIHLMMFAFSQAIEATKTPTGFAMVTHFFQAADEALDAAFPSKEWGLDD